MPPIGLQDGPVGAELLADRVVNLSGRQTVGGPSDITSVLGVMPPGTGRERASVCQARTTGPLRGDQPSSCGPDNPIVPRPAGGSIALQG